MLDDEIISLLRQRKQCTFFTNDEDFYDRRLRHSHFGLFYLAINKNESGIFVRKLLRHPEFDTHKKRMGIVACITPTRLSVWTPNASQEIYVNWFDADRRENL